MRYTVFCVKCSYDVDANNFDRTLRRLADEQDTAIIVPGGGWKALPIMDGRPVATAIVHGRSVRYTGRKSVPEEAWCIRSEYGCGTWLMAPYQLDERELRRAMADAMRAFAGPGDWAYRDESRESLDEIVLRSTNLPDGWGIEAIWKGRTPLDEPIGPAFYLERPEGMAESIHESGLSTAVRWMARRCMEGNP